VSFRSQHPALLYPQDPTAAAKYPGFGVPNGTALSPAAQQRVNHVMGILSNIRSRPAVRSDASARCAASTFSPVGSLGLPLLLSCPLLGAISVYCAAVVHLK